MNAWDEVEKMIVEMNTKILSIAERNRDLENENERLNRLVDTYKAKSEMVIELADDMVVERELKRVK